MKKEELFWKAEELVQGTDDNGALQALIDQGLDINQTDEYDISLAERAVFGIENYSALFTLWKAGAKAPTEYIEEIFSDFAKGISAQQMYDGDHEETEEILQTVELDLTHDFSVQKLEIQKAYVEVIQEELEFRIQIKPFLFHGEIIYPEMSFIGTVNHQQIQKLYAEGITFQEGEMEASSLNLNSAHNPVDLKKLKIDKSGESETAHAELFFDFDYEGSEFPNQTLILNVFLAQD